MNGASESGWDTVALPAPAESDSAPSPSAVRRLPGSPTSRDYRRDAPNADGRAQMADQTFRRVARIDSTVQDVMVASNRMTEPGMLSVLENCRETHRCAGTLGVASSQPGR